MEDGEDEDVVEDEAVPTRGLAGDRQETMRVTVPATSELYYE